VFLESARRAKPRLVRASKPKHTAEVRHRELRGESVTPIDKPQVNTHTTPSTWVTPQVFGPVLAYVEFPWAFEAEELNADE
jgi:hypothetical protein